MNISMSDILSSWPILTYWPVLLLLPLTACIILYGVPPLSFPEDRRPPKVTSWVPWYGSYGAMKKDFDGFMDRARSKFGDCFGVYSLGKTMYYVSSPEMTSTIYKQSKEFALSPMQFYWMQNIFGLSNRAMGDTAVVGQQMLPLLHKALSPAYVSVLSESFAVSAGRNLQSLAASFRASSISTKTVNLLPFIQGAVFDAATRALFGPSFPASQLEPFFTIFDKTVPILAMGYPSRSNKKFTAARQQLLGIFQQYVGAPQEPSELVEGIITVAKSHAWSPYDTAVFLLAILWPLQANSPYAVCWLLVLMLRTPEGLSPLVTEVDEARAKWSKIHSAGPIEESLQEFLSEASLPLLNSAIQETLRFATCSFSIRSVEVDGARLGPFKFWKGDHLVCATRAIHMDEHIFEDAGTFIPTRFVNKQYKQPSYLPFGGGISQCEGRHLALGQIRSFVVLLLCTFDVRLERTGQAEVGFKEGQRGFGMIRPKGNVRVTLTPRADHTS